MKKHLGAIFLSVFVLVSLASAQTSTINIGDWEVEKSVDLFTDEVKYLALAKPSQYPSGGRTDALGLACSNETFATDGIALYFFGSEYVSGNWADVTIRVDSLQAHTSQWFASRSSLVMDDNAGLRRTVSEMLGGRQIAIRYSAYSAVPTYQIPVAGLREVLQTMNCYTGPL